MGIYKERGYSIFTPPDMPATQALFQQSDAILYVISEALRAFKDGQRILATLEKERGSGIVQTEEYLRRLHGEEP